MGLFNFGRKNTKDSTEICKKSDEKDDSSKTKLGAGMALNSSVQESVKQANVRYTRPNYNPQTRKNFYDDGSAHKRAIDNAFANGQTVRDPYSNAELLKKQSDAKIKYGSDWQKHAAEADHIDPLSQIVKRTEKNPFVTVDDLKEVGNMDDNFQVLSRKLNQGSKEVGKGGSTQEEWANDNKRMQGLSDNIEADESIDLVSDRIKKTGALAEKRNNERLLKKSVGNVASTFHEAGKKGAQNAGVTAITMSGIMNIVSVIKGEKSGEDAVKDTIKDGGKAALTGYVMGGGMTTICQTLSYSSSEFIQALAKSNVPGKVITSVIVTGDTLKKWGNGEITTEECLIQLGDKGLNMATMGYSAAVGQALIPIPVVGSAVGALVGSMLTSNLYNNLINDIKIRQLEHEERMRIIAECRVVSEQSRAFRKELEIYLEEYFQEYKTCFDEALSSMQLAYEMGDADNVIAAANQITQKLGGKVQYKTVEEYKSFLDDDSIDVL